MFKFSVNTVSVDGLALLDARISAGTVLNEFGSQIYKGLALEGKKEFLNTRAPFY